MAVSKRELAPLQSSWRPFGRLRLGATLFFQRVFTVEPDNVVLNTAIQLLTPILAGFNWPCVYLEDTTFNDLDELLHLTSTIFFCRLEPTNFKQHRDSDAS